MTKFAFKRSRKTWSCCIPTESKTSLEMATKISDAIALSFDPGSILAQIQGHLIAVEPSLSETGEADEGELRVAAVHLTNHSKQTICIVGSSADCSCVTTEKLPKTILPGESLLLHAHTVYRGDPGVFLRRLVLLTDCPEQPAITVRVTGKVISSLHSVRPGSQRPPNVIGATPNKL